MSTWDPDQVEREILAEVERVTEKPKQKKRARQPGNGTAADVVTLPPPQKPMAVARLFVNELLTLRHWHGGWWRWKTSHWCAVEDRSVRSALYEYTEAAHYMANDKPMLVPWAPTRRKIGDLFEALAAICILADDTEQPTWLDGRTSGVIVATANGLLDVERRRLLPHTPTFFNLTSVPFAYDPRAPQPRRWLEFLHEIWPDEPAAIDMLGEWFGYVISGRLDLHKILLMVGPTRGGKGVIARILTSLLGKANVAGPTLSSLGGEFGLAPLIGKSLAVISDARFVGKNSGIVVERLLSISGEDFLTVNIKYKEQWTGKLPCRLHVISNELPKLGDASTAIVGRIVLLLLTRSWLGREDHGLELDLRAELPGVLNWALTGLERLTVTNGNRFTPLASADEAIIAMRDLASPVGAFVRERCRLGRDGEVPVDDLYAAYKAWADEAGHLKSSKHVFGRDLRAAVPSIYKTRPRDSGSRVLVYRGICLGPALHTESNAD
jgi:putative DNA primase/helicase